MSQGRKKKTILMVFPMVPYPLRAHGISIRYLPIIEYLSERHITDIIIINNGDIDIDAADVEALNMYCRKISVIQKPRISNHSLIKKIFTQAYIMLPWTPPNICVEYNGQEIERQIKDITNGGEYDILLWVSSQYSRHIRSIPARRIAVDFIDSPFLSSKRNLVPSRYPFIDKYERWKIKKWEAKLIRNSTMSFYISPVDANAVSTQLTPGSTRHVIPNGISINGYSSHVNKSVKSPNIGFLGNMGYSPNIEAVHWLYSQVFLPLRSELPDLTLYIIGRSPDDSIRALGRQNGVVVSGSVDDVWPYINAIDVFVFPLQRGAGLKNKVLEVMYAKRPVVTTKVGNEGIEAVSGRDLLICEKPNEFCQNIRMLLRSVDKRILLGEFANRFVSDRFSWDLILERFEGIIAGASD